MSGADAGGAGAMPSAPPLGPALGGESLHVDSPTGRLHLYLDGAGPPLLLLHSINAAGSAAEVRPLYQHHAAHHTVYALDLPGYGRSERSDRAYTPRRMTEAIHATVALIRQRHGGAAVDALALSLSCEFLARAAVERPEAFRSLALVSPTGFSGTRAWRATPGTTRLVPWLDALLRGPRWAPWGAALFRGLTRPGVIRYFLRRTWGARDIDETLWAYCVQTTRQPGAEHAPLAFLSAGLFSADIHTVYEALTLPVWASHGVRGDFVDYRQLARMQPRPNWQVQVFPTGALPHFEQPGEFGAAHRAFMAGVGSG